MRSKFHIHLTKEEKKSKQQREFSSKQWMWKRTLKELENVCRSKPFPTKPLQYIRKNTFIVHFRDPVCVHWLLDVPSSIFLGLMIQVCSAIIPVGPLTFVPFQIQIFRFIQYSWRNHRSYENFQLSFSKSVVRSNKLDYVL